MNPDNPSPPGEPQGTPQGAEPHKIPNTDMQGDDAGTSESGASDAGQGTAAEAAMKQTSKTDIETGSGR